MLSLQPHLHQAAAFTLGAHKQPRREAGDLGREDAVIPPQTHVAGQAAVPHPRPPSPGNTHRRCLQNPLVGPVQLEGLLVVQVGGGQGDGEVDTTSVGQDGILCQGLQSYAGVLGTEGEAALSPKTGLASGPSVPVLGGLAHVRDTTDSL